MGTRTLIGVLLVLGAGVTAGVLAITYGVIACFLYANAEAEADRLVARMKRLALRIAADDCRVTVSESIEEIQGGMHGRPPAAVIRESLRWPLLATRVSRPLSRCLLRVSRWHRDHVLLDNTILATAVYLHTTAAHVSILTRSSDPWVRDLTSHHPAVVFGTYLLSVVLLTNVSAIVVPPVWGNRRRSHASALRLLAQLAAGEVLFMATAGIPFAGSFLPMLMFGWLVIGLHVVDLFSECLAYRMWPAEQRLPVWRILLP